MRLTFYDCKQTFISSETLHVGFNLQSHAFGFLLLLLPLRFFPLAIRLLRRGLAFNILSLSLIFWLSLLLLQSEAQTPAGSWEDSEPTDQLD